jgi:hypothetical protein
MFKTLLLACALLAASPCFATFYVGGSLGVQNTGPYSGLFVNGFGGFEKFLGARNFCRFWHLAAFAKLL